jgi:hypothetical protein
MRCFHALAQQMPLPYGVAASSRNPRQSLAILEEVRVHQFELGPLLGQIVFEENRFYWTNLSTDATVDALVRVDEILVGIVR